MTIDVKVKDFPELPVGTIRGVACCQLAEHWLCTVRAQTAQDSYIETHLIAPSQTMVLELIRIALSVRKGDK